MYTRHKNNMFLLALAWFLSVSPFASAAPTGFGNRNQNDPVSAQVPAQVPGTPKVKSPVTTAPVVPPVAQQHDKPPSVEGVEWLPVSFEKAENEVLALFYRDLPKLEAITEKVTLYEVKTAGKLPPDYAHAFRTKMEAVLLNSKTLHLVACPNCEQSRLIKENGSFQYEAHNTDAERPYRIASETGAESLLFSELVYTSEDLRLRVRLVDAVRKEVKWVREYSTAEVVKSRERVVDSGVEDIGEGNSLSRVLIGEIAFTTVISPGVMMLPTIDSGKGASRLLYPSADIFIGEKYSRGYRRFGFVIGAALNMAKTEGAEKTLPFAVKLAPQFRYTFNPYNISTARYSLAGEAGALISAGLVTGYIGVGPEIMMMERFSVSFLPIYILKGTVGGTEIMKQKEDGSIEGVPGKDLGEFGGLALIVRANINW